MMVDDVDSVDGVDWGCAERAAVFAALDVMGFVEHRVEKFGGAMAIRVPCACNVLTHLRDDYREGRKPVLPAWQFVELACGWVRERAGYPEMSLSVLARDRREFWFFVVLTGIDHPMHVMGGTGGSSEYSLASAAADWMVNYGGAFKGRERVHHGDTGSMEVGDGDV